MSGISWIKNWHVKFKFKYIPVVIHFKTILVSAEPIFEQICHHINLLVEAPYGSFTSTTLLFLTMFLKK